ncbi:MAG: hypothetical protein CYPHOPRED_002982 [Cyphobasidiales sp. Tagirdzhanova-0007]|nr:MAG: hypothetical protein CYPHOPRED_002982 [Cyphobasidiales sp. Tagirdzhanova-0007]
MTDNRVMLKRLANITYSHADIEATRKFLHDFGFTEVAQIGDRYYYRGYGELPYIYVAEKAEGGKAVFLGAAFEAESKVELEKASKLKGASEIKKLDGPGGGYIVTIPDPWGVPFHVIWGQQLVESLVPKDPTKPTNIGIANVNIKARPAGDFQRFDNSSIVPIHKLGHVVLEVPSYLEAKEFYVKQFNLTPSDILKMPGEDGPEIGAFLHLDRGDERVDHHSMYFQPSLTGLKVPQIHHSAYEVFDVDHEFRAHEELKAKGYTSAWGVGRHILGSQLFDYWHQSGDGFNVEHYTDGDLVNEHTPVGVHTVDVGGPPSARTFSTWGPEFGEKFLTFAPIGFIPKAVTA